MPIIGTWVRNEAGLYERRSESAIKKDVARGAYRDEPAAAALNHPNILAVHDIGNAESAPYIVSEMLEGETLRERMAGVPLPVRKAVEYAIQIAKGLAAAHEKGIVHRDLSRKMSS